MKNGAPPRAARKGVITGSRPWNRWDSIGLVAIIAIVAWLGGVGDGSRLVRTKAPKNDASAVATMHNLAVGQAQFVASCRVDLNGDGAGEPGWLSELAGTESLRGAATRLDQEPYLRAILGVKDASGRSQKSGYYFRLFLLAADGSWAAEQSNNAAAPKLSSSKRWICYAWPNSHPQTGTRAYVMDQTGELWAAKYEPGVGAGGPYSGAYHSPASLAAFTADGSRIADGHAGETGQDGRHWYRWK